MAISLYFYCTSTANGNDQPNMMDFNKQLGYHYLPHQIIFAFTTTLH